METFVVSVVWDEDRTEYAVWCEACLLPSAIRLHFSAITEHGVMRDLAIRIVCTGCNPEMFDEVED
jgi:hypothetical protein